MAVNQKPLRTPETVFRVGCNNGFHNIAIIRGQLVLLGHPSPKDDLVMLAVQGLANEEDALAKGYRCYKYKYIWNRWDELTSSEKAELPPAMYSHRVHLADRAKLKKSSRGFEYIKDPTHPDLEASWLKSYKETEHIHQQNVQLETLSRIAGRCIRDVVLPYVRRFAGVHDTLEVKVADTLFTNTREDFYIQAGPNRPNTHYQIVLNMNVRRFMLDVWRRNVAVVDHYLISHIQWPFNYQFGVGTGYNLGHVTSYGLHTNRVMPVPIAIMWDGDKWLASEYTAPGHRKTLSLR